MRNPFRNLKVVWSKQLIVFLCIAFAMVVLDFATKWLVQSFLGEGDANRITIIENFFYINKSYNTAVAFSIGKGWGVWGRVLNIPISVVMSVAIFFYWLTHDHKMKIYERIIALLLGAGAVGNLIDRAFYWQGTTGFDGVIDFFQFYLGGGPGKAYSVVNPFATFNVADSYLTIGIIALLVVLIVGMIRGDKEMVKSEQKPVTIENQKEEIPANEEKEGE